MQGDSTDGSSLGDSLNLDDDGAPVDEVDSPSGGNNLGTVMSGKDDETADDGTTDDGTTDDGTIDDDADDGTTDDGTTDEVTKQHPVATALAEYFEVEYNEIMSLHESGYGFGNIAKAYFFADQIGLTPEELLLEAHGSGWGNVLKENGMHPGSVGNGGGNKPDVPGQGNGAQEPQNNGATDLTGPDSHGGNGHGNGNGGGNGHGGGNGGGNGHGGGHGNK